MFAWLTGIIGRMHAVYLSKPIKRYEPFSVHTAETLRAILKPGDILLAEGNLRFSTATKYLTQSTWSHAALFIGDALKDSQSCGSRVRCETMSGGSGGPVVGLDGQVVAVNSAILPEFGGSNLGVPAEHARKLLAAARSDS